MERKLLFDEAYWSVSMKKTVLFFAVFFLLHVSVAVSAVRLKDIAQFSGMRSNQLVGYGLVVGLVGTGDKAGSEFTIQSMANMLERVGVRVDKKSLKPKNVAAVMVTAKMPASATPGAKLHVSVSSIGDASSLYGGTLLMTPLRGIDGKVYALAQGSILVGGYAAGGEAAVSTKNVPTAAAIPSGATVERSLPFSFNEQKNIAINLNSGDFSTTMNVVKSINSQLGGQYAVAKSASTINLKIPEKFNGNLVPLLASLENLEVSPDVRAKVVVDEKTGTVVLGQNVTLSKVALSHGNLHIVVRESAEVSQPEPLSQGQTVVTPKSDVQALETSRKLMLVEGANIQELVNGLNAIGASSSDIMTILFSLKAAGALHADVEVI